MNELLNELAQFRDERDWSRHHTPRNLAMALSVETGELLECFLWDDDWPNRRGVVMDEVADVLIYALNMCLALDIDPVEIVRGKMGLNAAKYPVVAP